MNQEEEREEVYDRMKDYVKKRDQKNIKVLLETFGISYFRFFEIYNRDLLCFFTEYNLFDSIQMIIDLGWDVNQKNKHGENALFFWNGADKEEAEKIANYLIEKRIDMNCFSREEKRNIFAAALAWGCGFLSKLLYQKGANINWKDDKGRGILYYLERDMNSEDTMKEWVLLLLENPERCEEDLLRKLKAERLKLTMM